MNIYEIETKIMKLKEEKDRITSEVSELKEKLSEIQKLLADIEEARIITNKIAILTQNEIKIKLSHIVTLAIKAITGKNKYEFCIEFVEKREKTEIGFWLKDNRTKEKYSPFDVGGGIVDIISFSLRIAIWSLSGARNILIFDEPFKHLSKQLHKNATTFITEVSKELNLQMIIITQSNLLLVGKIFGVKNISGKSYIKHLPTEEDINEFLIEQGIIEKKAI